MPRTASAPTVEQRLTAIERVLELLSSERPGRKPKPLLVVKQRGVCAIDPNRDSDTCPDASIYRYQSGCHGDACRLKQHEAYKRRKTNGTAVEVRPSKTTAKRSTKTTHPATPKPTAAKKITKKQAGKRTVA